VDAKRRIERDRETERAGWRSILESLELARERNVAGRGACEFSLLEIYCNLFTPVNSPDVVFILMGNQN
jgi:hypothetical protein